MKRLLILGPSAGGVCGTCTGEIEPRLPVPETTPLRTAAMPPETALNISIRVFESENAPANSIYNAAAQVRSVETRYLPYALKNTLDQTGFWGAVRVMPRTDPNAELNVSGKILVSDGVQLALHLQAIDATGRVWLDNTYTDVSDPYIEDPNHLSDPFQDSWNRVANDLAEVLENMSDTGLREVIDVATLRYARELSPSFDRYLVVKTSEENPIPRYAIQGLPAMDDPVFEGVVKIRESEYLFSDGVDAHYESLYRQIGPTYAWWRYYSYELITGNQRLESIDATRGATRGSWYAMERIYKTYKEAKMNEDALRELTASFDRETAPTVAELSGRLVQLNGTLDAQYEEWRRLLRLTYREETGL